jgi:hypothetical protein
MERLKNIIARMTQQYEPAQTPPYEWSDQVIDEVINHFLTEEVNLDSSPGVPWAALGTTNKKVLDEHRPLIVRMVKARLRLLSTGDCRDLTAEEKVKLGFCDPVRLFVKNEPHGREKASTKRWRLIMSVSLVDQLVERVLNARLNKSEVANWRDIPSKGGSSMYQPDDVKEILSWIGGADIAEADISGFDWSVKYWELLADVLLRIKLSPGASQRWCQALLMRVECLALSVFSLSDGRLIAQLVKGIQKSGSYNTTPTNSHIRVMLAMLAGADKAIAIGDDGLESHVESAPRAYSDMGHPLKMYAKCVGKANFCSMLIKYDGSCDPVTWDKTFFRFLEAKRKDPSRLIQLNYVLGFSSQWDRIRSWLAIHGENLSGWTVSAEIIRNIIGSFSNDETQSSTTTEVGSPEAGSTPQV